MASESDVAAGALTDAQISVLSAVLPGLPESWARFAGTGQGLLGQGDLGAHAAPRAAFAGNRAALLGELARIGMPRVLAALDGREDEEELADFAAAAGQVLGAVAGPLFLAAVAAGAEPLAVEVAARLAELRDLAVRAAAEAGWEIPPDSGASDSRTPAASMSAGGCPSAGGVAGPLSSEPLSSEPLSSQPLPSDAGSAGFPLGGGAPEAEAGPASPASLAVLRARTEELVKRGTALAGRIREAADGVAAGIPVASAGRELTAWSVAVEQLLADAALVAPASDLTTLGERLAEAEARAAAERASGTERQPATQDALRAARLLHDQGLDALIPGMLRAAGFDEPDDWRAALAPGAPAPDEDVPAAATGHEPAPVADEAAAEAAEAVAGTAPAGPGAVVPERAGGASAGHDPVPVAEAAPGTAPAGPEADAPGRAAGETPPAAPVTDRSEPGPAEPGGGEPVPEAPAPAAAPHPGGAAEPAPDGEPERRLEREGEPEPEPDDRALPSLDDVQFPWDGSPPLIASLLSAGRDALAVCVAEASREPAARQRLLRFFCAAFSCSPAALELQMPELSPADEVVKELTADDCRLLLATVLRVGLSVGYSPVDLPSLIDRAEIDAGQIRDVVYAATEIVRHDYRRETGASVMRRADLLPAWAAYGDRARTLLETQSRGKLPLQRASNVLHHFASPDEPVGRALTLVVELSELGIGAANTEAQAEKWAHLERSAAMLAAPAGRSRLISSVDEAVSRGTQLRKPIVGSAKKGLDGALQDDGRLIADFLAARTSVRQASVEADLHGAEELPQALSKLADAEEPRTIGDAALRRLTDWLRDGALPSGGASVGELVEAELVPLYEIPRDASGAALRVPEPAEMRELLRGRDVSDVIAGYLRAGNIAAARALVATAGEADQSALDDQVQAGLQAARRGYGEVLASVYSIAGRLRAVYDDAGARDLTVTADVVPAPEDGRFDLATGRLLDAIARSRERLREHRAELRARALRCHCEEKDRERILSLIEREDEVLAVEFLTMAEAGRPLPEAETGHGDDFAAFFPAMVEVAVAATHRREDAVAAVRAAAGAAGTPANQRLADGRNAWRELKSSKRASPGDSFRKLVADVLRMIGLVPRDQYWLQELSRTQRSGYATFRVRATPVEGSYVPILGTQANNDYDLTLVWDEVTSTRLLDFIDERRRTQANIIVYFNTLDPGQRLQLRRSTRNKGFSPVVVDDAVAGWLTTLAEPGWRFTQRVTLPFTTVNPYSPFAGGEVPDEVFVGRERERAQIESPTGSMFVYGGRQLGKSALLRRVERMFTDVQAPQHDAGWRPASGRVAVYLDLKAASIGEAREPSALWPVLAERLVGAQVLPKEASRVTMPEKVSKLISGWLRADDGNRLLLLLDEADNFLTKDSRARTSGGGAEFPNLQRLKELMETSGRRFKPVFAGLHQVQRFHDSSNTPVAHGGGDILIGQLSTMAAYRLVVDPMSALGYRFASEEHVWRLLLFANYQASLVQIVCEALVREMSRKELPPGGGRIVIDAADVAAVIAKREVRDLIAQRFWWTINLDPRYRVIALVVAARSLDADPGGTFTPEDLHEFCELYWEAGFARAQLSGKEFRRYLEEMVGLGVLYRQDDEFGLRSPNILALLGTRQWIDQALSDAPRELEVRDEYNPSTNRRIIGKSTELWAPRSPLTDRDIAHLLGLDGQRHGRVQVVTGSGALGIGRAASVIRDVAEEQRIRCEILRCDEIVSSPHRRSHVVIDLSDSSDAAGELGMAYVRLSESAGAGATIIVGPGCVPVHLDGVGQADVTAVKRWSAEGLRSWHDTPFTTPDMRARLYRVTSGWPLLVERTMREIATGKSPDDALDLILARLADPGFARGHLADCGIEEALAVRWAAKFGIDGDDGLAEAFPATDGELATELGPGTARVVERLRVLDVAEDTPNGWVLDRAVIAAARALGA